MTSLDSASGVLAGILHRAAINKEVPISKLLVLGGTADVQREVLRHICGPDVSLAHQFGLGYGFLHVKDVEGVQLLHKLEVLALASPAQEVYKELIEAQLEACGISEHHQGCCVASCVVLTWDTVDKWLDILKKEVSFLAECVAKLPEEVRQANDEKIRSQFRRTPTDGTFSSALTEKTLKEHTFPLEDGQATKPLGVPLTIVVVPNNHSPSSTDLSDWSFETFEYIQQVLRSISLYYGAQLFIYNYNARLTPDGASEMLAESLGLPTPEADDSQPTRGLKSLRSQQVTEQKTLIPIGWDSYGKIRTLNSGFNCAELQRKWEKYVNGGESAIMDEYRLRIPAVSGSELSEIQSSDHNQDSNDISEGETRQLTEEYQQVLSEMYNGADIGVAEAESEAGAEAETGTEMETEAGLRETQKHKVTDQVVSAERILQRIRESATFTRYNGSDSEADRASSVGDTSEHVES